MSSDDGKPIDFDVVREPWQKYELNDTSTLKVKYVLTRLWKKIQDNKPSYRIDGQTHTVMLIPPELRGPIDTRTYSKEELESSIVQDEVRYNTISEEWYEYIVDDGTRIRLKMTVTRIAKTSKFDRQGEPVYLVDNNVLLQVRPPKLN